MKKIPATLAGVVLIIPDVFVDERGLFLETYRLAEYKALGVRAEFVQDNHSRSTRSTIRGLHFQTGPGQAKLVRCARGSILDVVVDIRRSSATYGKYELFQLDDETHAQVFVPTGFAHGFCVTSETADVAYKVSSYYDANLEAGIAWDDPDIAIPWPTDQPLISLRDRSLPRLQEIADLLPDW